LKKQTGTLTRGVRFGGFQSLREEQKEKAMKRFVRLVIALGATFLSACGGSGPTAPGSVPSASGAGGQPQQAVVQTVHIDTVGGVGYAEGAAVTVPGVGTVEVRGGVATFTRDIIGLEMDIMKPGYLIRKTVVRGDRFTIFQESPEYVGATVYGWVGKLIKLPPGEYTYAVDAVIASDEKSMDAVSHALAEATRATTEAGGAVVFKPATNGPAQFSFSVNPSDPFFADGTIAGVTYLAMSGSNITGGRIVFRDTRNARTKAIVVHEVGHGLGLWHSPDIQDVMNVTGVSIDVVTYSDRLVRVLTFMHSRPSGQIPEDDDRRVSSSAIAVSIEAIACP
jgi:hypothetical protein